MNNNKVLKSFQLTFKQYADIWQKNGPGKNNLNQYDENIHVLRQFRPLTGFTKITSYYGGSTSIHISTDSPQTSIIIDIEDETILIECLDGDSVEFLHNILEEYQNDSEISTEVAKFDDKSCPVCKSTEYASFREINAFKDGTEHRPEMVRTTIDLKICRQCGTVRSDDRW